MVEPNINNFVGEKIKQLRKEALLSQKSLAEKLQVSTTAVTNWESGYRVPKRKLLSELSDFFGVTISYFFPDYVTEENETITKTINIMNQLNNANQKEVYDYAKFRLEKEITTPLSKPQKPSKSHHINDNEFISKEFTSKIINFSDFFDTRVNMPISWNVASAGTGAYLTEDLKDMELVPFPKEQIPYGATFGVPIDGNSMLPHFKDGWLAWIKAQPIVEIGEIGLFSIDDKGYIKKRGETELISTNSNYDNIPLNEFQDIKCWGKVIGTSPMPN